MLSEQYYEHLDELERQINECPNPEKACALCPLWEVCDKYDLIAQAENACDM